MYGHKTTTKKKFKNYVKISSLSIYVIRKAPFWDNVDNKKSTVHDVLVVCTSVSSRIIWPTDLPLVKSETRLFMRFDGCKIGNSHMHFENFHNKIPISAMCNAKKRQIKVQFWTIKDRSKTKIPKAEMD